MKTLNEKFTDKEFARLKRAKKSLNHYDRSWHDFLLHITTKKFMKGGKNVK